MSAGRGNCVRFPDPHCGAVITFHQPVGQLDVIEIACDRWDRLGRLRLACPIAQYGPDIPVAGLLRLLSADCPGRRL